MNSENQVSFYLYPDRSRWRQVEQGSTNIILPSHVLLVILEDPEIRQMSQLPQLTLQC